MKDQNANTNKNIKFNPTNLNKQFEENKKNNNLNINNNKNDIDDEYNVNNNYYPHKQTIQQIIINIRDLFFIVLEMIIDKKNPLPFIFAFETRIFSLSIFLLLFGSLLLLLASLMKSPN